MTRFFTCGMLLALAAALPGTARGDEVQATVQKLMEKYQSACVRVHATAEVQQQGMGVGGGEKDTVSLCQGLVVDKDGLTIVSRSTFDQSVMMAGLTLNVGGEEHVFDFKSKFKKIEMELADGTRVPAKILIADTKWDLVVVAPKKPIPAGKIAYVPIDSTASAQVFDEVVCIRRMSPDLDNQMAANVDLVTTIIEKPMRMYLVPEARPSLGVFNLKGELIGVTALKMPNLGDMIANGEEAKFAVLPCEYVKTIVEKARKNMDAN